MKNKSLEVGKTYVATDTGTTFVASESDVKGAKLANSEHLYVEVTPVKKGDSITIIGRRWFDKVNGNTYHSCECLVNGKPVANVEFAYGYDDQYKYSGMRKLAELGYLPDFTSQSIPWRYCDDKGITLYCTHSDVNRKKDL